MREVAYSGKILLAWILVFTFIYNSSIEGAWNNRGMRIAPFFSETNNREKMFCGLWKGPGDFIFDTIRKNLLAEQLNVFLSIQVKLTR